MSFSPVSFSRISFNGASQPVEQDGRSGYWRLFFTQLQEEAGKQHTTTVTGPATPKQVKKLKTVKILPTPVEVNESTEIPYVPIAQPTPQPEVPCYLAGAWRTTTEIRGWLIQHRINSVKYYLIHEAANEEDEDIELLLLAA